ncbi:MAG: beta-galactosidase [Geminicoccaceae bacterium]|nr:beta-galactosidase [Geminicoccaceae bacterium]
MTKRALGVCYYPEHWPEEGWAEDARRMKAAGIAFVRIGEFAWSRLEPGRGDYRFEWLARAIDTLHAAGLKVVLGTPTATPPKWLVDAMPDMLPVGRDGRTRGFGSRRHYDFAHEGYRAACARIVEALARRFGRHPAVVAWQTNNEYACHDKALSYSQAFLHAFRDWLGRRLLLIRPRSGSKTASFAIPSALPPDLPKALLDLKVARVVSLRPDDPVPLAGGEGAFCLWREFVELGRLAEAALRTDDGLPALVAQGRRSYLADWPDDALLDRLVADAARACGLRTIALPDGLRLRQSGDRLFAFNYGDAAVDLAALGLPQKPLLGETRLGPSGVAILPA